MTDSMGEPEDVSRSEHGGTVPVPAATPRDLTRDEEPDGGLPQRGGDGDPGDASPPVQGAGSTGRPPALPGEPTTSQDSDPVEVVQPAQPPDSAQNPEPVQDFEPVEVAEPAQNPEPAQDSEPVHAPEPVQVEPVQVAEPVHAPEPVQVAEPVGDAGPEPEPQPDPDPAPAVAAGPMPAQEPAGQAAPDGLPGAVRDLMAQLDGIGRDDQSGGYRRLAWTAEDRALGEWFAAACEERGLTVSRDRCGNQWAWWDAVAEDASAHGDPDADRTGVVTGSHLDSVPGGGAFDGPLGVVGALLAVDLLRRSGFTPRRPIGIVRFADEEGARFGLPCAGSRLLTGAADPDQVLALTDADGVTYADALRAAGVDPAGVGPDPDLLGRIGTFVELHIEQGYGLAGVAAAVGAGRVIRPHGRWRADLRGRADHAGTALLSERDDAMLEFARLVQTVRQSAARQDALATVGKVAVVPNAANAVPSRVTAWIDVRADAPGQVRGVVSELQMSGFDLVEESWTPATVFDDAVTVQAAKSAATALGLAESLPGLVTGAGHDAGVLASAGIPATMLFVRNPTGVSHSPLEAAEWDDCAAGVRALAAVLADLSG